MSRSIDKLNEVIVGIFDQVYDFKQTVTTLIDTGLLDKDNEIIDENRLDLSECCGPTPLAEINTSSTDSFIAMAKVLGDKLGKDIILFEKDPAYCPELDDQYIIIAFPDNCFRLNLIQDSDRSDNLYYTIRVALKEYGFTMR